MKKEKKNIYTYIRKKGNKRKIVEMKMKKKKKKEQVERGSGLRYRVTTRSSKARSARGESPSGYILVHKYIYT